MTIIYTKSSTDLAKKIQKQRKKFKITQEELGAMADCTGKTISNWELWYSHLSVDILIKILIALSEREPLGITASKEVK